MRSIARLLPFAVALLGTGCCVIGGHYKEIKGEVDPNARFAKLPVKQFKTYGQFNVHSLECGQLTDHKVAPKTVGMANVPLEFCAEATESSKSIAYASIWLEVAGKREEFYGFCEARFSPSELRFVYTVSLHDKQW